MVSVSIYRTRTTITGDDPVVIASIVNLIGSAHVDENNPNVATCKTSVPNMKRIKRIVPNAKASKDPETQKAIAVLLKAEDEWARGGQRLRSAKAGGSHGPPEYDFCFQPYKHQLRGFHWMHADKRTAIFGDCGIGKTAIAASFLDSLKLTGEISPENPALVVCPISIIQHAWIADLKKFTQFLKFVSVYEPSAYKRAQKRIDRLETPCDVYVCSFSLVRIMEKLLRKKRFRVVIVDESTKIKNPQAKTYRSLKQVAWKADYRYIMSGTPAPNGPLDLWSQFFFIDEGLTLEPSIVDFRHEHFTRIEVNQQGAGFWVPRRGMSKLIYDRIEPRSIRFKASECLDLPEQVFSIRELEMTGKQEKVYVDMVENMFAELDGEDTVTARIPLSKLMKLREITGGFVITDKGEAKEIGKNPKILELDHLLDQILGSGENKAIVWIQYQWEARTIISKFRKQYGAVGLYGEISQGQKDKNISAFLEDKKCRLLVAHPQSAAHGLTLTTASYSIYYSLSHNFEDYYQSSKRIHRPGQKKTCFYYFLVAKNSVDESLLGCIQDKKNVQDLLIDGKTDPKRLVGIRK